MSADWLAPGVTLVIGPERLPLQSAIAAVRGDAPIDGAVLLVGGPPRDPAQPARYDRIVAGATPAMVRAWLDRTGGSVVVDGAGAIGGALLGDRPEDRIRRFAAEVAPQGTERLLIVEPLPVSGLTEPDAAARRLLMAPVALRCWDGQRVGPLPAATRGRRAIYAVATLLVSVLVAVLALRPALQLDARGVALVGDVGASLPRSLWLDWWIYQRVSAGEPIGWTDALYWPAGLDVVSYFRNLGAAVLSLPFQRLFGFPDYWIPFVGCALVSNGVAAAWMARRLGSDRPGAVLTAAIFAGAPALMGEVGAGAQDIFWAAPLPLAIGLGVRALDSGRAQAIFAGLAVGLASLIWWFYGLFAAVVIGALVVNRLWRLPLQRAAIVDQTGWMIRAFLPATVAALPLLAEANRRPGQTLGWMRVPGSDGEAHRALLYFDTIARGSLPLDRLLAVPEASFAWIVSLGALLLVATGLLWRRACSRFWSSIAVISAILAIGPALDPAWGVSESWTPLPLGLLQQLIPPLRALDVPDRLMILCSLALGVVAASVLRTLSTRVPRAARGPAYAATLAVAIATPAISGALPLPVHDYQVPAWASVIARDGVVVHVPLGWSEAPMLWQIAHGNPIIGGPDEPIALADKTSYRKLLEDWPPLGFFWSIDRGSLDAAGLNELRAKGVRYVVLHQRAIDTLAERLGDDRAWQLPLVADRVRILLGPPIYAADGVEVYRLPESLHAS